MIRGAASATTTGATDDEEDDDDDDDEGIGARGDSADRSISKAIAALCCWDFLRASRLASSASFN